MSKKGMRSVTSYMCRRSGGQGTPTSLRGPTATRATLLGRGPHPTILTRPGGALAANLPYIDNNHESTSEASGELPPVAVTSNIVPIVGGIYQGWQAGWGAR